MTAVGAVPEAALERILREGLRPRRTVWSRLARLWSAVGPGNLFLGTLTRVVAAVFLAVGLVLLIGTSDGSLGRLFALAPLLFLSLMGFVEGAERIGPLAELRRTLRYSGPQLAAFRILVFGVLGLGFSTVLSVLLNPPGVQLSRALMVTSVALAGSAWLTLALLQRISSRWAAAMLPLTWALAALAPVMVAGDAWETVLGGVPDVLGWAVGVAAAGLFARQLRILLLGRAFTTRGIAHAARQ